ncbi:hypothetical protein VNO80_00588 [Phaseolus coccineus]|uniref:Uncharacterized protein n=1 Tax=Phaseolus coccineus TaxID=3886 RepID=A0AAN9P486_PHACN
MMNSIPVTVMSVIANKTLPTTRIKKTTPLRIIRVKGSNSLLLLLLLPQGKNLLSLEFIAIDSGLFVIGSKS